jgi:hypothetical protein
VKSIASDHEIAAELPLLATVTKYDPGAARHRVMDAQGLGFKQYFRAGGQARRDKILNDFVLGIDGDASAHEILEMDAMPLPAEREFDTLVNEAFSLQAIPHARLNHQIDGSLLEDAGAHSRLDVLPGVRLQHNGLDALKVQEVRKKQAGRSGADNSNLSV